MMKKLAVIAVVTGMVMVMFGGEGQMDEISTWVAEVGAGIMIAGALGYIATSWQRA